MSAASHSRAAVRQSAADLELERLHTLALALRTPPQSAEPRLASRSSSAVAVRPSRECVHSSLAKRRTPPRRRMVWVRA
eukprot:4200283-Prymnesium_polylepis.1